MLSVRTAGVIAWSDAACSHPPVEDAATVNEIAVVLSEAVTCVNWGLDTAFFGPDVKVSVEDVTSVADDDIFAVTGTETAAQGVLESQLSITDPEWFPERPAALAVTVKAPGAVMLPVFVFSQFPPESPVVAACTVTCC
jgi:hypothetical protein